MEDTAVFVLNVDEDTPVGTTGSAATGNLVVEVVSVAALVRACMA